MVKLKGISRNTLKEHFRQLVDKGYLSKQGGGRST
jgi:DNA-binding HxlR family transcriptional regulator